MDEVEEHNRKYLKDKYFIKNSRNPLNFRFKNHEPDKLIFNPFTLDKIIELIIEILEQEYKDDEIWEKII